MTDSKDHVVLSGTIELPRGFRFAGVACGIKPSGKPDLSLIVAEQPVVAAGVYTQNQIVAAPVILCRQRTPSTSIRAVVTNSGNANACTGPQGMENAEEMCRSIAQHVGCREDEVLVMSTGVIGKPLPMDRVNNGIDEAIKRLGDQSSDFQSASDAILTTDQSRKVASRVLEIDGKNVTLTAMAKGAGMIAPDMATMLAVVMTDAVLTPQQAQKMIADSAEISFNCASVDGHTSTNDTLLLLASGGSDVRINEKSGGGDDESRFVACLNELCIDLAKQLVADGEGARHWMQIRVSGALDHDDAKVIAKTIGASPLVKTAITGADPNWGRIVSAAGYAGPSITPEKTSLRLCGVTIYDNGSPVEFDAKALSQAMKQADEVTVDVTVGDGPGEAMYWASDLTTEYVRFNSEYTT